jgi:endonuclease YncB( thermonuclease family)
MLKTKASQVCFRLLAHLKIGRAAIELVVNGLLIVVSIHTPATAQSSQRSQSGLVTHVVDGDTVWVQIGTHNNPLKVRLQGVDAPEICQAGGVQAQAALASRVLGQRVTVTSSAHDDYGRAVGTLRFQGEDMGRWLVANGHAWVYSFRQKKGPYADEFAQAQAVRRGLFSDAQAQEPRAFRKSHGSCYPRKKRF